MKIGLCGTMSVGKSTLAQALSQEPEFDNHSLATERSKYLRDLGIPLNTDSTLKGQTIFLAERCSELLQPNIITDRTIIDVLAFTRLATSIPHYQADAYEHLASELISEYDYIFYISPEGVEIEDNGVREVNPEYREKVDHEIKNIIKKYKGYIKNYSVIQGTTEERIEKIKQATSLQYL